MGTSTPTTSPRHATRADSTAAVDAWMAALDHPSKMAIQSLRKAILSTDASIAEGIKWNAPSFRTGEYFATVGPLRSRQSPLLLILHLGAKARALPEGGLPIDDPDRLLTWLDKARARITFTDLAEVQSRAAALQAILRQWIALA